MIEHARKKKAVGYTRVSTPRQARKGESLLTQESAIKKYAELNGYELVEIFSDEGISGGTVAGRPALKRLLANLGGIDCLIVYRLSRLGRNSRELLNNVNDLQKAGLETVFTEDNIDLSTPQGRALLTILSSVAQLEREIIAETSIENKIARCRRNIPATGRVPWGRFYDNEMEQWFVDEEKKALFERITEEYIAGGSLREICKQIPKRFQIGYSNYLKVLERAAGDTWEVKFKKEDPIKISVPPLLEEDKIQKAMQMRRFNATSNRHDVKRKYLLSGFIRCGVCGKALVGQTQNYSKYKYKYYQHTWNPGETCKAVRSISGNALEQAVLAAIWENVIDEKGFNQALSEKLPNKKDRERLEENITKTEVDIKGVEEKLSKLVDAVLEGILTNETIKAKETELLKEKALLNSIWTNAKNKLSRMADPKLIEEEAWQMRLGLQDYFGSVQRFREMDFDEIRQLLHNIFDGDDEDGNKRGVYIKKIGNRKYEYFMLASVFEGLRVMYRGNYDYYDEKDPDMPEYQVHNELTESESSSDQIRKRPVSGKTDDGASGIEKLVEINGIKRKRKFM